MSTDEQKNETVVMKQSVRFMILGKYPVDLDGNELLEALRASFENHTTKVPVKQRTYFHFIRNTATMNDLNAEAAALETLLQKLPPISTVTHYFGGIGISAAIAKGVMPKAQQTMIDIAQDCVTCLRRQGHHAVLDDSMKNWSTYVAELNILDFNSFTLSHMKRETVEWKAVSGILNHPKSRYMILLDSACSKFRLNKKSYARMFARTMDDFQDYKRLCASTYERLGWRTLDWLQHKNAAIMLLEKNHVIVDSHG